MYDDLFGVKHYEPRDVARKIVTAALNTDFVTIKETVKGVYFQDKNRKQISFFDKPGLYALYKGKQCLYVGMTAVSVYNRVYRFQKELKGESRIDESHAGAIKAREDGIKTLHRAKMKFFPMELVHNIIDKVCEEDPDYGIKYRDFPIDEYIAPLVKSKYNTRKVYM